MTLRHILDRPVGSWLDEGACVGKFGDLWYEDRSRHTDQAVAICKECPVADLCLQWALTTGETWGIWGGKTAKERENIRRREGYAAKVQASPVRVLSPTVAAATADRASRALALKQARAQVLGSLQAEADEVAERFRTHRANNNPLLDAARNL
jgi:WhiB family redox-sensing transcriptional regulator